MCPTGVGGDNSTESTELVLFVNGKKVVESSPDPSWTLLYYLRNKLGLCGTKEGCGVGGCGACTVMVSRINRDSNEIVHLAVNACITPLCSLHGAAVTTVEGIGSTKGKLHPIQERLAKSHGSQCGFCTPGFVMSMYALIRTKPGLQMEDIEEAFQGNLCRCTGYRPIFAGVKSFITDWERDRVTQSVGTPNGGCSLGKNCCKNNSKLDKEVTTNGDTKYKPYDASQEPIFPSELQLYSSLDKQSLKFYKNGITWLRPTSLEGLIALKNKYPNSKIVSGNTEIGIEVKFGDPYPILISPQLIKEFHVIETFEDHIKIGGGVTLSELRNVLRDNLETVSAEKVGILKEIHEMLYWFAGKQVRNVATVAGNIVTSSPISDLSPIFLATKVRLNLMSEDKGNRKIIMDDGFFIDYRKNSIRPDEVITSIEIPFTKSNQFVKAIKQARRREDDISIVTAAFNVIFDENSCIKDIRMAFGGMAKITIMAKETSEHLKGKKWNAQTLEIAISGLINELTLDKSSPGGMTDYRMVLCPSLFMKFYVWVTEKISTKSLINMDRRYLSAANPLESKYLGGSQYYDIKTDSTSKSSVLGKPVEHTSALKQASGEALYGDDIPAITDEYFLAFVMSQRAHANIIQIDPSEALKQKDVVAFYSYHDIDKTKNIYGLGKDDEVFAAGRVRSFADVVGVVVAKEKLTARSAAKKVRVEYEDLPYIITLEEAIEKQSFYSDGFPKLKKGDIGKGFQESKYVFEGQSRSGAQEHFYLEPFCAYARPKEDELEIMCPSQHPCEKAEIVAHMLDMPLNKVKTIVKRIGGAFGGKETRLSSVILPVAFAANKLGKPVRCVLDRAEDMQISGNRHPFLIKYKVGCDESGKILAAEFQLYNNGGCTMDFSRLVLVKAIMHIDNVYNIPNIVASGFTCKTNLPSNTAFRGFGAPQGMLATEVMIRHIAQELNKDYMDVAQVNMYNEGDLTHMNQLLERCTLQRCWDECLKQSDFARRKDEVDVFNSENRYKKKGLSIVPTKYLLTLGLNVYMQATAYVMIYNDGSVLIHIGGVEMGQGLYPKMIQIAAKVLNVDISIVHISETRNDTIPNQGPTAGSMGSDLFGMAVLDACTKLKNRIQPYKDKIPDGKWNDWIVAAWLDRVNLAATGHYVAEPVTYCMDKNEGRYAEYFTYGVAVTEVIIDCLSGDHQVLRTDIVMDVGESLNPAIDVGQIEGAFTQGYGLYVMEELMVSPSGKNISNGPGNYKIPTPGDTPREFNVSLLRGAPNPRAVFASKAIGEPPLFLASSVYFAIKEAIISARKDANADLHFFLSAPATCEKIRLACVDEVTKKVTKRKEDGQSWFVVA